MLTLLTLSRAFIVFSVALVAYSLTVPPVNGLPVDPRHRAHPSPAELAELEQLHDDIDDAEAHGVIVCIVTSTYAVCE